MSEVSLRLNLPPEAQYMSGHSLIVKGETLQEVKEVLAEEVGEDRASFIVGVFFENILLGGVKDALDGDPGRVEQAPKKQAPKKSESAAEKAKRLAAARKKGAK